MRKLLLASILALSASAPAQIQYFTNPCNARFVGPMAVDPTPAIGTSWGFGGWINPGFSGNSTQAWAVFGGTRPIFTNGWITLGTCWVMPDVPWLLEPLAIHPTLGTYAWNVNIPNNPLLVGQKMNFQVIAYSPLGLSYPPEQWDGTSSYDVTVMN
jgi:hypothetical protein